MAGRDPHEDHRAATPLELLFDLSFVVAFGAAGNELAHALAEDHVSSGIAAFAFITFGICWAWINYSWFASAFDTDDWAFRLLTMVQMCGVIVFALGIHDVFVSIDKGPYVDNGVVIAGYVVMRVALVGQWLRVMRQDPEHRPAAKVYVVTLLSAQVLWVALWLVAPSVGWFFVLLLVPFAVEVSGPAIAERRFGGTPWNPHHIAERYGLLAIITLGEGVIGTMAAMQPLVEQNGWTEETILLLSSGVGLTFGMWWTYFAIPWGEILHYHRERSFVWGYGHMAIFGGIAATGAGLHAAELYFEDESKLGTTGTLLAVAVPVAAYLLMLFLMYAVSMRAADPFHLLLLAGTAAVVVVAVFLAASGVALAHCLVVVALAPVVTIVGYESLGHRHLDDHLEALRA